MHLVQIESSHFSPWLLHFFKSLSPLKRKLGLLYVGNANELTYTKH
jgi:hypothetical protein